MVSVIRGNDNFDTASPGLATWTSGNNTWAAGGTYTLSHSLGTMPKSVQVEFVCVVAVNNYSVGDVHVLHSGERYADWGLALINVTSSTIKWGIYSSGIIFRNSATYTSNGQSPSYWRVRFALVG